jgi:hypothetical protein
VAAGHVFHFKGDHSILQRVVDGWTVNPPIIGRSSRIRHPFKRVVLRGLRTLAARRPSRQRTGLGLAPGEDWSIGNGA